MSVVVYERQGLPTPAGRTEYDASLKAITAQLQALEWVDSMVVCGSYAKGSLVPGWSDLDIVAVYSGRLGTEQMESLRLTGPDRANPSVPVSIDYVAADALAQTRRVVGRPLAMALELRHYAFPVFGKNLFSAITEQPNDASEVKEESEKLVRADANNWLRRRISGHPSLHRRMFDATKTLLRIAMFESSPLPKDGFAISDYCDAVCRACDSAEIADAFGRAQNVRCDWPHIGEDDTKFFERVLVPMERALLYYCEAWSPKWDRSNIL